jgi:hypothetical protein
MNSSELMAITVLSILVTVVFIVGAIALKGQAERWSILGVVVSFIGTGAAIIGLVIQHNDAVHFGNTAPASPHSFSVRPSTAGARLSQNVSSAISLASNSPLRKRIPSMDDICGDLGQSTRAWLPGQTSPTNYTGRVIFAPEAAFTWSCKEGGPTLTPADITRGCQIWYPGSRARTWDPNSAYSWVCI